MSIMCLGEDRVWHVLLFHGSLLNKTISEHHSQDEQGMTIEDKVNAERKDKREA